MDPLSDVLSLLKLRSYVSGGFNAAGAWAVEFGEHEGIKFHAVVEGSCWVSVDGASAVRIGAGECFLLPRGKPFVIASDLCVQPIPAQTVLSSTRDGRIVTYNQGGEFLSVGGYCTLADQQADLLLKMLPPIIHIREAPDSATVRWCIERMAQELRNPQPGEFLVAQQLATLVLVQTLRLYLSDPQHARVGWLFALADKRMRAAIAAMHADPGRHWTLQALAEESAMSRTTFAQTFKRNVGLAPMDYLTRWRMTLAAQKLRQSRDSVASIALAVGYESEKSFSAAFKRIMRSSPRRYGEDLRAAPPGLRTPA